MTITRIRAGTFTNPAFTNPANAVNAGDGTYATWVNATRRGATTSTFSGFDHSSIPDDATVNSVTWEMRHYVVAPANMATITVDGIAVSIPSAPAINLANKPIGQMGPASLPTSVDVVHTRGNNTTSTTAYIDWLEMVVDWTPAPIFPPVEMFNGITWKTGAEFWNGTQWRTDAEIWDGVRWRTFK